MEKSDFYLGVSAIILTIYSLYLTNTYYTFDSVWGYLSWIFEYGFLLDQIGFIAGCVFVVCIIIKIRKFIKKYGAND